MRSSVRNCFVYLVVVLACMLGTSFASAQIVTPETLDVFEPPDTEHITNDDEAVDPDIYRQLPSVDRHRAFLPVAVDLTNRMPFPGDQGALGSCQAWATAYAARSYYTAENERRDLRESQNVPSPNYVFHLARDLGKSCDAGSNVLKTVEVLKKGALSLAEYPYSTECGAPPPPQAVAKASDFRVLGYQKIDVNKLDDIKGQLYQSNPVIISFASSFGGGPAVSPNSTAPATPFNRLKGDQTYNDPSIDFRGQDQSKFGWHAMVIAGYDDRRQAFRLVNSWGQRWGDRGYLWLSYDLVPRRIRAAGILKVEAAKRPPPQIQPQPKVVQIQPQPPVPAPPKPPQIQPQPLPPAPPQPQPQPQPPAPQPQPPAPQPPAPPVPQPQPPAPQPPAPQPLPPAPRAQPPLPAPRAQLSDLQNLSCGKVAAERYGGSTVLTGYVSSLSDLDLVKRVAENGINTSLGNLIVAPWPQCEALQTLEKPLTEDDQPKITIGAEEFRGGDTLRIEIKSPAQISYLYIAYIQADGSVVNLAQPTGLVPQPTLPNTTLIFGDGQAGRAKFTVGPPYGREMIVALASRSPLFEGRLPAEQTEREYLTALRRALIYKPSAHLPDREVGAAITTLQTRAR
jgi:Domain of unknown function (DUF4384)/Papain family cysteine protease